MRNGKKICEHLKVVRKQKNEICPSCHFQNRIDHHVKTQNNPILSPRMGLLFLANIDRILQTFRYFRTF